MTLTVLPSSTAVVSGVAIVSRVRMAVCAERGRPIVSSVVIVSGVAIVSSVAVVSSVAMVSSVAIESSVPIVSGVAVVTPPARGERCEVLEGVVQHHAVVGDVQEGGGVRLEARESRLREATPG